MNILKRSALLSVLFAIGLLEVFIYGHYHLYYQAEQEESLPSKVAFLEKSATFFPWNDMVFYELGKSYFDLGISHLEDASASTAYLRKSVENLQKAVLLNPASPFSHFQLAQSLLNLRLIAAEDAAPIYDEFRKAALLAGEDSHIFNEVGLVFLSRWADLSDQDKGFTRDLLKKTLVKKDKERFAFLLNTWELNARDYEIIEQSMPEDAQIYRQYAQFLGEKSLSLEERHKYLTRAEFLEFQRAKNESLSGETALSGFRIQEAQGHFQRALNSLKGISFFQALSEERPIDDEEFSEVRKSLFLNLAKCRIEKGASPKEYFDDLRQYLHFEDDAGRIDALAGYLQDRGVVPLPFDKNFSDLDRVTLGLLILYKQEKYREVINFGRELERSPVFVPGAEGKKYLRILRIVGDALQGIGHHYNAEDFYQKALQIDPGDLETLLRLRQNSQRLNDKERLIGVNAEIAKVMTLSQIDFRSRPLRKGQVFSVPLTLDGQNIDLDISFNNSQEGRAPLLSVFFNGRVVWENYLQTERISIALEAEPGENVLQMASVNSSVSLQNLVYRIVSGNADLSGISGTQGKDQEEPSP